MKKTLLFFIQLFLLCIGCTNEISVHLAQDLKFEELVTESKQYAPYESVNFRISNIDAPQKTLTGKIGEKEIEVIISDSTGTFILPGVASGIAVLKFSHENNEYKVSINVKRLSDVQQPDVYMREMESVIYKRVDLIEAQAVTIKELDENQVFANSLLEDTKKYRDLLATYKDAYNQLSASEKEEFAKCIEANKKIISEFNALNSDVTLSFANMRTAQVITDYEKNVEITQGKYLIALTWTIGHIPVLLTMAKFAALAPDPFTKSSAILALGLVMINFQLNLLDLLAATQRISVVPLKPFDNLEIRETVFTTGTETLATITGKYRSLFLGDGSDSSNGGVVIGLFNACQSFKTSFNNFVNMLPDMFKPKTIVPSISQSFKTATRNIYNKYVKISNVSNSNVTLDKLDQADGSIKLKATNKTPTDQDFTFQIEYSNVGFTSGLRSTVSAKVIAQKDSAAMYRKSALGKYSTNIKGNVPQSTISCELKENGVAEYQIFNDPHWKEGQIFIENWGLTKKGNRYYITTSFTNPGHILEEAQPLSYPVSSFIYRDSYTK